MLICEGIAVSSGRITIITHIEFGCARLCYQDKIATGVLIIHIGKGGNESNRDDAEEQTV